MKKKDLAWALVEATDELAYLRAKLDVLKNMLDREEAEDLEFRIRNDYIDPLDWEATLETKKIREIFEWPVCREVSMIREEYVKRQEEEAKAREAASKNEEQQEERDREPEETGDQAGPEEPQTEEPEEIREEEPEELPAGGQEEDDDPLGLGEAAERILSMGSPKKTDKEARSKKIIQLYKQGELSMKEIARQCGCSVSTGWAVVKKWRQEGP